MLIEILTPMMLASQPLEINLPPTQYDHSIQMTVDGVKNGCTATINGTQTFGMNGHPSDRDGDNDSC